MAGALPGAFAAEDAPVRVGLMPVFLDSQVAFLSRWREYLSRRLDRIVEFVQRGTYREIVHLLHRQRLDFAWICGLPYLRHREKLKLMAVPVYLGRPLYQSYLIVSDRDTRCSSILDLRGKVFAYSDPDSNSGFLYPNYALLKLNEEPAMFFGRTFFAWSHRNVVEAVASGLAQGGAVDGYVWDTLAVHGSPLVARTRVVQKSPEFGFPPFVAANHVPTRDFARMQRALLSMQDDPQGLMLLESLNLNGFVAGEERLFDGIATMMRTVDAHAAAS